MNKQSFSIRRPAWPYIAAVSILLMLPFRLYQIHLDDRARISTLYSINQLNENSKDTLTRENEDLKIALKLSQASPKPQVLTKKEARVMISATFPKEIRERFLKITAECENRQLLSTKEHLNSDSSIDYGLSQINSVHRAQAERLFGLPFEVVVKSPIMNYIFAAFLYDHDRNLHAWSCERILAYK